MAVLLTIKGEYKTNSVIAGMYDLVDYQIDLPYPVDFDIEDDEERGQALFYIRNFFLDDILKKEFKKSEQRYLGFYSAKIDMVEELDDKEVKGFIKDGSLSPVDPYTLTAREVMDMKPSEIRNVLIYIPEDITPYVAQNSATYKNSSAAEMRAALCKLLDLKIEKEERKAKGKKRTASVLGVSGSSKSSEESKTSRGRGRRSLKVDEDSSVKVED